jgi:hypothetical protein
METHVVQIDAPKPSLKNKTAAVLAYGGLFFILWTSWNLLWPSSSQRATGFLSAVIEGLIIAVLWAVSMVFGGPIFRTSFSYKLLVDDNSITGVSEGNGWMRWWATRRTIRKGKVRAIFEIPSRFGSSGGVGVSERTILCARLCGFVFLPKSMHEYENLEHLVESWRTSECAD